MPKDELKETLTKTLKAVLIIYAVLLALFFAVSTVTDKLPKPYHKRTISAEVTPWLK
ncbi:MAG: hypothetical protein II183_00350 [Elusimicrobiaceae bacterium]|jgi:hypothetical protein|nr:hypothetical protein [Elusimicrobiaceae bacterium]MBQ3933698.1 hypothetical protein [Elusimicrobiaceae bacterium]